MADLRTLPRARMRDAIALLCGVDDTLTEHGRLPASSYDALERLRESGLLVVPVTARSAGWCDMIARLWPVDAVVGENGGVWCARAGNRLVLRSWGTDAARAADRARLDALAALILDAVPGADLASDQPYRSGDLAIDVCEDVPELPPEAVAQVVSLFQAAGAMCETGPVHVVGRFGGFDRLAMLRVLFAENFGLDLDACRDLVLCVGDGANDAGLLGFFPLSVDVGAVPGASSGSYATSRPGPAGFVEFARAVLGARV